MSDLTVTIQPVAGVATPKGVTGLRTEATYSREVQVSDDSGQATPIIVQGAVGAPLDESLTGRLELPSASPGTPVVLRILSGTGATRLQLGADVPAGAGTLAFDLSQADVTAIASADITATPLPKYVTRDAQLAQVAAIPVDFARAEVRVLAVDPNLWSTFGLDKVYTRTAIATMSVEPTADQLAIVANLEWTPTHLGVDGRFRATFEESAGHDWLWWLSAPGQVALGAVDDDLGTSRREPMVLPLPPFAAPRPTPADGETERTPIKISEIDLADNPDVFTEDPGAYCRPFSNPERILGERAFHVILRAEQPEISSDPTRKTPSFPLIDFDPPEIAVPEQPERTERRRGGRAVAAVRERVASGEVQSRVALRDLVSRGIDLARPRLPDAYLDFLDRNDRGRTDTDPEHPLDWEGDVSRYQAATVARGHILEYRLRWRSNGYSLGTVAKTLTLAPRQVRRIQKVEWERLERTRRTEQTQLIDQEVDAVVRDRTYEDSVEASLSEWSRGESRSSTSAAAGGFGFATAGFVIGGGGGHSQAVSTSSQSGGRQTSASEEQRLRDSIRRFADSLRRLESVVVTEVSQEESVTGTTEVVRNANYAHSLTVIYYQILRHLKLETVLGGVRECLFMPFAIKPFTLGRAYRWRESIRQYLRDPRYSVGLTHVRDVLTNFAGSPIPDGRRADQPVKYIRGSISLAIGVERPNDGADGAFDPVPWAVLRPHLGTPAVSIFARLRELAEAYRDRVFQEQEAPRIAASWVNTLQISASGRPLPADFTLATRYRFNGAARIDFTAVMPASPVITRQLLTTLTIVATDALPPGSVANLTGISYTYDTATFRRSVSMATGVADMINPESGAVEPGGATAFQGPDEWELRNERDEVRRAVQDLLGHLNEHVEYYHKGIWWSMDRDRIFMIADGTYVPGTNGISVASLIERDPIAIIGNSLVFRVAAGAFLGIDGIKTPEELFGWYADRKPVAEPMHVALPTDGLYAQTIMDECDALEEHFGNTDWVLSDSEPELGTLDPALLMTRRAEPTATTPTPFPQTIINLQNAPDAPDPSGLAGVLGAVTNPNTFRDMAGLAGTQANAAAGLQVAANLATNFGNQAAALKLAEMAAQAERTRTADQKLATIERAKEKKLVDDATAAKEAEQVLDQLHTPMTMPPYRDSTLQDAIKAWGGEGLLEATSANGTLRLQTASTTPGSTPPAGPAVPQWMWTDLWQLPDTFWLTDAARARRFRDASCDQDLSCAVAKERFELEVRPADAPITVQVTNPTDSITATTRLALFANRSSQRNQQANAAYARLRTGLQKAMELVLDPTTFPNVDPMDAARAREALTGLTANAPFNILISDSMRRDADATDPGGHSTYLRLADVGNTARLSYATRFVAEWVLGSGMFTSKTDDEIAAFVLHELVHQMLARRNASAEGVWQVPPLNILGSGTRQFANNLDYLFVVAQEERFAYDLVDKVTNGQTPAKTLYSGYIASVRKFFTDNGATMKQTTVQLPVATQVNGAAVPWSITYERPEGAALAANQDVDVVNLVQNYPTMLLSRPTLQQTAPAAPASPTAPNP